ncbi:hypothetical protein IWW55_000602 [Coemansia sp. RSA 2706]|nr:hypothetical protein IWW55_000602 [Coemansia sp. RSA 2706]
MMVKMIGLAIAAVAICSVSVSAAGGSCNVRGTTLANGGGRCHGDTCKTRGYTQCKDGKVYDGVCSPYQVCAQYKDNGMVVANCFGPSSKMCQH